MDVTSPADAGEHRPSTPSAQTGSVPNGDFPTSPLTSEAGEKLDDKQGDKRAENSKIMDSAQPDEDEQPSDAEFRDFDWDDLQDRYAKEMEAQTQTEHKIQEEFNQLMAVCRQAIGL